MNIKLLGGENCYNCKVQEALLKEILAKLNIDYNYEKIVDIETIMNYNVMSIPALVIDEKVIFSGKVADKDELTKIFNNYKK